MDKDTRNAIERATQKARKLLEQDFAAQLEGDFDVHRGGEVAAKAGKHLSARDAYRRERIVAAIEHKRAAGMAAADAARDYLRDAAFTTLNRFVALKMLEARELVQECITQGEQSGGYREFCGMAPGLPLLPESAGYRLYIESLFDELSTEVKVLFDRRDPSSVLWPKRATFGQLLEILNSTELARVWGEDETIGWVYQFFNGQDERRKMREESQAPRNSRELAVRNQFFTPRYVVQFLTDNTLGRIWYEMRGTETALADRCEYMVRKPGEEFAARAKKDPRDLRVLDPACGSGHFLLYAFDLLLAIYEEAYGDPASPKSEATGKTLAEDYPSLDALKKAVPGLVLAHNLHGVDIDPRCAQIAQLALWMRAQKAYRDFGIGRGERARIRRSSVVVAEPLVADDRIAQEFVAKLEDAELGRVFSSLVDALSLAGDLGLLLRLEQLVARQAKQGQSGHLFAPPEVGIRAAIHRFVREERSATNTRRRLFADDANQAIGLLAISELKFDAVLMNPPFGDPTGEADALLARSNPSSKHDLAASFVDTALAYLAEGGLIGALTTRTIFLLAQSSRFRADVLGAGARIKVAADLGYGVLDATVETAAYVVSADANHEGSWIRLVNEDDKANRLRAPGSALHIIPATVFGSLPNTPFLYWMPKRILDAFRQGKPFESEQRFVRCGMGTLDDFRFVRCWWEVAPQLLHQVADTISHTRPWTAYAKGGEASPYVIDMPLVVNFGGEGREVKAFVTDRVGSPSRKIQAERFYRRPGIQFGRRVRRFSPAALPAEAIFSDSANAVFVANDDKSELLAYLGLLNGGVTRAMFSALAPVRKMEVGYLQRMPVPELAASDSELTALARAHAETATQRQRRREASRYFLCPGRVTVPNGTSDVDRVALERYGLTAEDVAALTSSSETLGREASPAEEGDAEEVGEDGVESSDVEAWGSWLVGVAFGRFDPRLATGERAIPAQPEPFDPLPSRSPGMYPEGEEPADRPDILVDDEGHGDDLAARVVAIAERVKVDVPESLRAWLAKEWFPLHIKMYSKSRRKAPMYWQLATPSAGYSVWLYLHAFSKDTLFRVQNDYVALKLAHEERRLESLTSELRDRVTVAQRKQLAAQEALVEELRALLDEVKRVAPLWKPNLDDGVIINFAPLWRLVPQNKAWQKELKATWDALADGKYDWAHLAMHLWPERVVPKCAKDRSLAIAHGLEDVFWVEGADGKWTARRAPTKSVDELVKERTSPAAKSALKSLLEAAAAVGVAGAKKGKANA